MADIKWIKLSVNMFDDEKIKLIRTMPEGDSISMIWIQMLCLAGKINDGGMIYMGQNLAYSDEMLATILGHPINIMRAALKTLEQFSMIEINDDGMIDIVNWEKHQNIDGMNLIREQNRKRKRKFDLRKKAKELGFNPDSPEVPDNLEELEQFISNVTVTLSNDIDKNKRREDKNRVDINNNYSDLQSVVNFYQENISQASSFVIDSLRDWSDMISPEVVLEAIKVAVEMNVRNMKYINGVLKNWHNLNVKNVDDVKALRVEYENNKAKKQANQSKNNKGIQSKPAPVAMTNESLRNEQELTEKEKREAEEVSKRLKKALGSG